MEQTVITRIAIVLCLVGVGWLARRRGLIEDKALGSLSRLLVDVSFPALVFVRLLQTVSADTLLAEWTLPVGAVVMLCGGWLISRRLLGDPTEAFLIGLPNWIFLPLLIAEGLYGTAGARPVLLFNAGAQVALWTVGVATLTRERDWTRLLKNPGLWATLLGLAGALLIPSLGAFARAPQGATGWGVAVGTLLEAVELLGVMSMPLALCITGAQLSGLSIPATLRPSAALFRVLLGRLVLAPALFAALLFAAEAVGLVLSVPAKTVLLMTAAMPVAISAAVHARRFGGNADLAAQSLLWSTVLSLATVPLLLMWVR